VRVCVCVERGLRLRGCDAASPPRAAAGKKTLEWCQKQPVCVTMLVLRRRETVEYACFQGRIVCKDEPADSGKNVRIRDQRLYMCVQNGLSCSMVKGHTFVRLFGLGYQLRPLMSCSPDLSNARRYPRLTELTPPPNLRGRRRRRPRKDSMASCSCLGAIETFASKIASLRVPSNRADKLICGCVDGHFSCHTQPLDPHGTPSLHQ